MIAIVFCFYLIVFVLITIFTNSVAYAVLGATVCTRHFHRAYRQLLIKKTYLQQKKPIKIVGLVQARNEEAIIAQCLQALCLYTDAIIVLDDHSSDNTLTEIYNLAQVCSIKKIITNEQSAWLHGLETDNKKKLLQAGRDIGGTHFICIDADELLTANLQDHETLRSIIFSLQPGDSLSLWWIQLWRNIKQYRIDNWCNKMQKYKPCIFADNGICDYGNEFLHMPTIPGNLTGLHKKLLGDTYGLMHFQFVNWHNVNIKQRWYKYLERIRLPNKSIAKINARYALSTDETGLQTQSSPPEWFANYHFFNADIYDAPSIWREKQLIDWEKQYAKNYFKDII